MSSFSVNWLHFLLGFLVLALFVGLAVVSGLLLYMWRKKSAPTPEPKAPARAGPPPLPPAPAIDPEEYAKRVAYLTAKQMIARQTPATSADIDKYPDLQALAAKRDQEAKQVAAAQATLAEVTAVLAKANALVTATPKAA